MSILSRPPHGPRFAAGAWSAGGGGAGLIAVTVRAWQAFGQGEDIGVQMCAVGMLAGSMFTFGLALMYYHARFYTLWGYERDVARLARLDIDLDTYKGRCEELWRDYQARQRHYSRRFEDPQRR